MPADKPTMPLTAALGRTPRALVVLVAVGLAASVASAQAAPNHEAEDGLLTPRTMITYGPSFETKKQKVEFRFTDSTGQLGSSFRCKVDGAGWRRCHSPLNLSLGLGAHTLRVRAVNVDGVGDPRPALRHFKVVG